MIVNIVFHNQKHQRGEFCLSGSVLFKVLSLMHSITNNQKGGFPAAVLLPLAIKRYTNLVPLCEKLFSPAWNKNPSLVFVGCLVQELE
jgi:hypothetical protein